MANVGKILTAFVGGVVLGGVAALLLAPKSGAETREQIKEIARQKGINFDKEQLEQFVNRVMAKVKDYMSDEEIADLIDKEVNEDEATDEKA